MDNHLLPMSPRATRLGLSDHIVDLGNVDGISFDILQNGKQKMQPQSFICVVVEQPVLGLQFQDGGEDGGGDCEEGRLCASAEDERPVDLLLGEEGEVSDFVVLVEEVGVGQLVLALLVGGVEELEDLLADEGVGAVDEEDEFVDFAVPLGNGVEVLDVADLLVSVDDDVVDLLDPGLLSAELDVLLLVLLHDHGLDGIEVPRLLLGGLVDVDQVVVVVVLHEEGAEVGGAVRVVLEVVGDYTEGLLLVIDYIVFFLIVFQLFVGQVRKYLHVLLANPLPLLRQQHLLLRNYRLGLPGLLQVHLHVGDVPRVGGALEGDELGDVVADVEDHLGVDDDEEEEEDAEDQQVEVAVLAEVAQELLVAVGLPHFQCHFFSLQEHAYFELKPCAYYYSCLNYS